MYKFRKSGHFTGFITLIMLLSVSALASVGAAALYFTGDSRSISVRSAEYVSAYYAAQSLSEERLALVDGCIVSASRSEAFDLSIEAELDALGFVSYTALADGYSVTCETPISSSSVIFWEIYVPSTDIKGGYSMVSFGTRGADLADETEHPAVWDGSF